MADSTWSTADVQSALADITPSANGTVPPSGPPKNEEAAKLARDQGWVQPTAHNYKATAPVNSLGGGNPQVDTAQVAEGESDEERQSYRTTTWSHDAAKYEWKEEYGDVGPRDERLEKDLFHGEHITRAGAKLDK